MLRNIRQAGEESVRLLVVTVLQPLSGRLCLEAQVAEDLTDAVVEFPRQALAFLQGGHSSLPFDQSGLCAPLLGDVVQQEQPPARIPFGLRAASPPAGSAGLLLRATRRTRPLTGRPVSTTGRIVAGREHLAGRATRQVRKRPAEGSLGARIGVHDPSIDIHHQHAFPHLLQRGCTGQRDWVQSVKTEQDDGVQTEHRDEHEGVRVPLRREAPAQDAELEEEPRGHLAEHEQRDGPPMPRRANKQPEEQGEIDDGQQIAVDERGRQACAEHRLDPPVDQGEVGPGEIVKTTGQDEGGGQDRRNSQEDNSATGEQTAKAHVLEKEASCCRHQRQLPEGDELQPEDLGVGVDGCRLEH